MELILALILAGFGIFAIVDPEEVIYLQNFWKFDDFFPSERHIRYTRISGWFCAVMAVFLVVYWFST